jgi:hypothetical protein
MNATNGCSSTSKRDGEAQGNIGQAACVRGAAPIRLLAANETVTLVTIAPVNSYLHVHTTQNEDG